MRERGHNLTDGDLDIRNETYRRFVELGRAPKPEEIDRDGVADAWQRLHDAHALVLRAPGEIRMANPFSAVPTSYRVTAAGRDWWANCAWDAIGICAALDVDGEIETACPDCDEPITLSIRDQKPDDESLVFHCLIPARVWWDDIAFT